MTSRQQLYHASVWSIRLCSGVLYSAVSIRLAFTCAQRRGRLYRFPIGGLSSWSLGWDGGDSRLIYSPPPELGSRTRTRWPIWNYLPRISLRVSVHSHLSDVHFNVWVFWVNEWCRCLLVWRRLTHRLRSSSYIRCSEGPVMTPGCHCLRVKDAQMLPDL